MPKFHERVALCMCLGVTDKLISHVSFVEVNFIAMKLRSLPPV